MSEGRQWNSGEPRASGVQPRDAEAEQGMGTLMVLQEVHYKEGELSLEQALGAQSSPESHRLIPQEPGITHCKEAADAFILKLQ